MTVINLKSFFKMINLILKIVGAGIACVASDNGNGMLSVDLVMGFNNFLVIVIARSRAHMMYIDEYA